AWSGPRGPAAIALAPPDRPPIPLRRPLPRPACRIRTIFRFPLSSASRAEAELNQRALSATPAPSAGDALEAPVLCFELRQSIAESVGTACQLGICFAERTDQVIRR